MGVVTTNARYRRLATGVVGVAAIAGGYVLVVRGDLTLDLGWGRSTLALGPQHIDIAAQQSTVFEVISEPYLGRTPKAMTTKLTVVERGADMVLAAHHTPAVAGLVATTLETVRFEPPERIEFRLVRGPVPHVRETFKSYRVNCAGTRCRGHTHRSCWKHVFPGLEPRRQLTSSREPLSELDSAVLVLVHRRGLIEGLPRSDSLSPWAGLRALRGSSSASRPRRFVLVRSLSSSIHRDRRHGA